MIPVLSPPCEGGLLLPWHVRPAKGTPVQTPTTISIIDDDPSLCNAVSGLLRSFGYETRGFDSAEAFLAWEGSGGCDCVITDIHMPGMSGIDLKQTLVARQQPVPVIMITG